MPPRTTVPPRNASSSTGLCVLAICTRSVPGRPAPPPSADLLYSNGLRDFNGQKYDLATQEFQDYLKYYPTTDLASNAAVLPGRDCLSPGTIRPGLDAYRKVIDNYPEKFQARSSAL